MDERRKGKGSGGEGNGRRMEGEKREGLDFAALQKFLWMAIVCTKQCITDTGVDSRRYRSVCFEMRF